MTATLVKCSSAQCAHRDFFPNQLTTVVAGEKTYHLCPECDQALMADLASSDFMRGMCKAIMTMGEIIRMRKERAQIYSERQHAVNGWPVRVSLPAPEVV